MIHINRYIYFSQSIQSLSPVLPFATPWITAHQASPIYHHLPEFTQDSCPSSRWCHPATLSSVVPFSSCPQSFPASGSFQMSQLFAWSGQSIGVSASASVLPMNTQDWSPLGWTGWIFLQDSQVVFFFLGGGCPKVISLFFFLFLLFNFTILY